MSERETESVSLVGGYIQHVLTHLQGDDKKNEEPGGIFTLPLSAYNYFP